MNNGHVSLDLNEYINLEQYPIDDLDSQAGGLFLNRCHEMMEKDSICILPGFLRTAMVKNLAAELTALAATAHPMNQLRTPYGWMDNTGFDAGHPRAALFRTACGVITTDQLSFNSYSRQLFHFDELTACIRRMLGFETLYRSECPTLSIQVNVLNEGDTFGWHFDTNDGVVSLIIQQADEGGAFEFAPKIRDEEDESYEAVSRLFAEEDRARAALMPAGTFALFLGRRSVHRVTPVGKTQKPRLSLLYSYDQQPGMKFPEKTCQSVLNPSSAPYLGALTSVGMKASNY